VNDGITSAARSGSTGGHGFGTAPVFLASISTILGAVMFLRFGYAVGHVGLGGALLIVLLGHLVTIPTALAIAEIATNRRVEGGGEYFIISRSFGTSIGGTIGIALFFSQALSVAFYMIAFAESVRPLAAGLGLPFDPRVVSLPGIAALLALMLTRGARLGVNALWVVVGMLALSLAFFALGGPPAGVELGSASPTGFRADPFILVFAIVFPAFTGMTAGVGLSGDLENPRRSIPLGVLSATVTGALVYVFVLWKLATSASQDMLVTEQLVMSRIALWGPIIPIGLACATLSSAIGSIMVAPRTLQALAADRVVVVPGVTDFLAAGKGRENEPWNGTIVTAALAFAIALFGSVDFVARIISMFFMVTYGSLCAISFLEHFAARPSYRPSFRSKWYVSLFGAIVCVLLMFQMDPLYAIMAILLMGGVYYLIQRKQEYGNDLSTIFFSVMTQATRNLQIRLQKMPLADWRPSVIMITGRTFDRSAPKQLLKWLCYRYGFGTYLHYLPGLLNAETYAKSREVLGRMIRETEQAESGIYVDTMISPSMQSALAQTLQAPGVSGMENNTIAFEFSVHDGIEVVEEVRDGILLATNARMNSLVLRHGDHHFGNRSEIHVWLMWHDYQNANLLVLLAYIILGHPDWRRAELSIFAAYPDREVAERRAQLREMILAGRIPVAEKNVRIIPTSAETDVGRLVEAQSAGADLVLLGFTDERLQHRGLELLQRYPGLKETLWVGAAEAIEME
jgi:amino acid transporter